MTLRFRFEGHLLDASIPALVRDGEPVPLQKLLLDLLLHLVSERHRVVSTRELLDVAWAGVHVSRGAVHQAVSQLRLTIGDDARQPRLIATERGRGYRFVGTVEQLEAAAPGAWGAARTDALAPDAGLPVDLALASPRLLGREAEFGRCAASALRASRGQGHCLLVGGEPGVGKTSLLEAFRGLLATMGFSVLMGTASTEGGAYAPWRSIAAELFGPRRLAARLPVDQRASALSLFPDLAPSHATLRGASPTATGRTLAFTHFFQALAVASAQTPLAVVLDDLHLLDDDARSLLDFVVARLPERRLLLCGAARTRDLDGNERGERLLADLSTAELIRLEGLGMDAARTLIERHGGRSPAQWRVEDLLRQTRGNPFLLQAMARMDTSPATARIAVMAGDDGTVAVVRAALAAVPQGTRELLELAAAHGDALPLPTLAALTGSSEPDLRARLAPAVDAGVVELEGRSLRLGHSLYTLTLLEDLSASSRRALHARFRDWFARRTPGALEVIALHAAHAVDDAPSAEVALAALRKAAAQACDTLAFGTAVGHYERALTLAEDLGHTELLEELALAHADALARSGRIEEAVARVAALADGALARTRALATLAYARLQKGFADRRLIGLLQRTLADAETPAELSLALSVELAHSLRLTGHAHRAHAMAVEAVALGRARGDDFALLRALGACRWTARGDAPLDDLGRASRDAVRLAERLGDPEQVVEARLWRMGDALESGDRDTYDVELDRLVRLTETLQLPWFSMIQARYGAVTALLEGRWDAALAAIASARSLGDQCGDQLVDMIECLERYPLLRGAGRLSELEPFVRGIDAAMEGNPGWRSLLAHILAETGRGADARDELRRLIPELDPTLLTTTWLSAVAFATEAAHRCGDGESARALLALLPRDPGRHVLAPAGSLYLGPVARLRGLAHETLGELPAARAAYAMAEREALALRSPPYLASCRDGLARVGAHGE